MSLLSLKFCAEIAVLLIGESVRAQLHLLSSQFTHTFLIFLKVVLNVGILLFRLTVLVSEFKAIYV